MFPQFARILLTILWHFIVPVALRRSGENNELTADLAQEEQSALLATAADRHFKDLTNQDRVQPDLALQEKNALLATPAGRHFKDLTKIVSDQDWSTQFDNLLKDKVPGLDISFLSVFEKLNDEGCPVWVFGGAVRDVVAGMALNDVDVAVLCTADKIEDIVKQTNWKWERPVLSDSFGIGDQQSPQYLEGFPLEFALKDYQSMEYATSVMGYSPHSKVVIDLTGHGIEDARAKILRPAMVANLDTASNENFKLWYDKQWKKPLFRYYKMINRGWKPHSPEFRKFMRNQWEEWVTKDRLNSLAELIDMLMTFCSKTNPYGQLALFKSRCVPDVQKFKEAVDSDFKEKDTGTDASSIWNQLKSLSPDNMDKDPDLKAHISILVRPSGLWAKKTRIIGRMLACLAKAEVFDTSGEGICTLKHIEDCQC